MKVKINGLEYTITEVDEIEIENGNRTIGVTKYITQEILILNSLSREQKEITLKHELCHAFLWTYGFGSIGDNLPVELVCDFVGIYSKQILDICENYFKQSDSDSKRTT